MSTDDRDRDTERERCRGKGEEGMTVSGGGRQIHRGDNHQPNKLSVVLNAIVCMVFVTRNIVAWIAPRFQHECSSTKYTACPQNNDHASGLKELQKGACGLGFGLFFFSKSDTLCIKVWGK